MAIEGVNSKNILFGMDFSDSATPLSPEDLKFANSKGDFRKNFNPEQLKAFNNTLCMSINYQIRKDEEEAQKALRKLRASAEGKDHDDVE